MTVGRTTLAVGRSWLGSMNQIANLALWYRPDFGVTLATGVSQINDQSLAGNNAVQAGPSRQPIYTPGFTPYMSMTGDAANPQFVQSATNVTATVATVFVVAAKPVNASDNVSIVCTDKFALWLRASADNHFGIDLGDGFHPSGYVVPTSGVPQIFEVVARASTDVDLMVNGAGLVNVSGSSYHATGFTAFGYAGGGRDTAAAVRQLWEVLIWTRELSAGERNVVRGYLASRYKISIP